MNSRFRRVVLGATAILTTLTVAPADSHAADTFRVVGTGDSILHRLEDQLQSTDRWWDLEPGRELDLPGAAGRASYMDIWPEVIARSRPGGYVVFEDDGTLHDPNPTERWTEFMQYLVDSTPDDRCLVGVLTYFDPAVHEGNHVLVERHRDIMRSVFEQQPCVAFVAWDEAVVAHPEYLADGQHPSEAGQLFLASRIDLYVGFRR